MPARFSGKRITDSDQQNQILEITIMLNFWKDPNHDKENELTIFNV